MSRNDLFLLLACAVVAAMMASNPQNSTHLTSAAASLPLFHQELPEAGGTVAGFRQSQN